MDRGVPVTHARLPSRFDSEVAHRSECSWDYTIILGKTRVRIPPGPLMGARSSEVRAPCPATLVAALSFAAEAQTAGHLTGTEEMEGAIPSGGSAPNAERTTS